MVFEFRLVGHIWAAMKLEGKNVEFWIRIRLHWFVTQFLFDASRARTKYYTLARGFADNRHPISRCCSIFYSHSNRVTSPESRSLGSVSKTSESLASLWKSSTTTKASSPRKLASEATPPPPVSATVVESISRLCANRLPASLERFRSLAEKRSLLDAAVESCDFDALIQCLLYCRSTLSETLFANELKSRPAALRAYVNYLRDDNRVDECVDLLDSVQLSDEAGMLRLEVALRSSSPDRRMRLLTQIATAHLRLPQYAALNAGVSEYKSLLEVQLPVEKSDRVRAASSSTQALRLGQSLLGTLDYAVENHYDLSANNFASPLYLRQHFRLTNGQYEWTTARALIRARHWDQLKRLLAGNESSSWLPIGRSSTGNALSKDALAPSRLARTSTLTPERIVQWIAEAAAGTKSSDDTSDQTPQVIDAYIRLVEPEALRVELSARHEHLRHRKRPARTIPE